MKVLYQAGSWTPEGVVSVYARQDARESRTSVRLFEVNEEGYTTRELDVEASSLPPREQSLLRRGSTVLIRGMTMSERRARS